MRKVFGLTVLLSVLSSLAGAHAADSAKAPMTADEACKLAYQWTNFGAGFVEVGKGVCRAELVDTGNSFRSAIRRYFRGPKVWIVVLDSVRLYRTGMSIPELRQQPVRRCELIIEPTTQQLLFVSLATLAADTSNVAPPEERLVETNRGSVIPEATPAPIALQTALNAAALINPLSAPRIEAVCVHCAAGKAPDTGAYWWLCAKGVPSYRRDRRTTSLSLCIDATTGKVRCGLTEGGP